MHPVHGRSYPSISSCPKLPLRDNASPKLVKQELPSSLAAREQTDQSAGLLFEITTDVRVEKRKRLRQTLEVTTLLSRVTSTSPLPFSSLVLVYYICRQKKASRGNRNPTGWRRSVSHLLHMLVSVFFRFTCPTGAIRPPRLRRSACSKSVLVPYYSVKKEHRRARFGSFVSPKADISSSTPMKKEGNVFDRRWGS